MPFQDSDPERRNLMITSLGFILFFWGGGELKGDSLKLPMFNIEFFRPEIIAFFAWLALLWFLYRYWLKHSFVFWEQFSAELCEKRYLEKAASSVGQIEAGPFVADTEHGFHIDRIYWQWNGMHADCTYAKKVSRDQKTNRINSITGHDPSRNTKYKFEGLAGWKTALAITGDCMFSKPSFSSYFIPYALCTTAVISGVVAGVF